MSANLFPQFYFLIKVLIGPLCIGLQVGFCNLIKRAKDQMNHLWVAEATENSNYFLSFDPPRYRHLKEAALSTHGWAKVSELVWSSKISWQQFGIGDDDFY